MVITPMALVGAVLLSLPLDILNTLGSGILNLAIFLLKLLWMIFEKLYCLLPQGMMSWALPEGGMGIIYCILGFLGMLLLLAPKGLPAKNSLGIIFCLPMMCYQPMTVKNGECIFDLLDVGQGLGCVIRTAKHVLIFDAGPKYGSESDAGMRVFIPYLQSQHIGYIDKIMISHTDLDHRGGLEGILKNYSVGNILSSEPERLPNYHVDYCIAGTSWVWDGVLFEILHPGLERPLNRNDRSCVLQVTAGEKRLLLTGDIEKSAEVSLLKNYANQLQVDILVVPHHGSKTSSHEAFIEIVKPQYALFPTGKYNRYGFPREEIIKRYQKAGSQILNNANTGMIRFYMGENQALQPYLFRDQRKRFWHQREHDQC
jgi:competence protein ComEC